MPKRSDDYMAERRRHILEATIGRLMSHGWNRTTIDDVAAAAGLSKGAVYIHFSNKKALLVGLLERNVERLETHAEIASLEALRTALRNSVAGLSSEDGWLIAAGQLEAQGEGIRDPEIRALLVRATARLEEIYIDVCLRLRPDLPHDEARTRALGLIVKLEGMRSFRTMSSSMSEADVHMLIDRELQAFVG